MNLQELKNEISTITNDYIRKSEKFKKSPFAFMKYITAPYSNFMQARTLRSICDSAVDQESFISKIYDTCKTIKYSSNLLPEITLCIVNSGLFPEAKIKHQSIESQIDYANQNNDGGGAIDFWTHHYIAIINAGISKVQHIELTKLAPKN